MNEAQVNGTQAGEAQVNRTQADEAVGGRHPGGRGRG